MGNLKKAISLHYASQISGYHQDYLSSLIRKNEIKGEKLGGSWFTTEEEINKYIFKQKIRNKNWLAKNFLLFIKANTSFIYAFVLLAIISTGIYFYNKTQIEIQAQTVNTENSIDNKLAEEIKEMKF